MRIIAVIAVALAAQALRAEESPAAKQYRALLAEYEEEGGARAFAKRFLALAEEHPKDPVSADALLWVVKNVRGKPDTDRALALLTKHHASNNKLGSACNAIADSRSVAAEQLLRALLEKQADKQARARACYQLASLLDREAELVAQLKSQPELAARVLQYYGTEYGKHLSSLRPAELMKRREQVYALMLKAFPDVTIDDGKLGTVAEKALFALRHLSVGKLAPEIKGKDVEGKPMKLSDYRGKIVLLSFWAHW